jgi:hypothetical protein
VIRTIWTLGAGSCAQLIFGRAAAQVTSHRREIAPLFPRLDSSVFGPALAMLTADDVVLPFPFRRAFNCVDDQLDELIYDAYPTQKPS